MLKGQWYETSNKVQGLYNKNVGLTVITYTGNCEKNCSECFMNSIELM